MPKLDLVMPEGPRVTKNDESQSVSVCDDVNPVAKCAGCQKDNAVKFRCKRCHTQSYCSRKCQKKCWSEHKVWCDSIVELVLGEE